MAELIAQGPRPELTWAHPLPEGELLLLGREAPVLGVPWDKFLSRSHARLVWAEGLLRVEKEAGARNAILVGGREVESVTLRPGDSFRIGETTFSLVAREPPAPDPSAPLDERAFPTEELERIPYRSAPERLRVLSRLPELIAGAADDGEVARRLVELLLAGIPSADVVALVLGDPAAAGAAVLCWRSRSGAADFKPSNRLVREALCRQQALLHLWSGDGQDAAAFTLGDNLDWAFCTPVRGEACRGWGIYVAGSVPTGAATGASRDWAGSGPGEDVKFTELVASILHALREVRLLQHKQASFGRFFSPAVLRSLSGGDPDEVLRPRETDVAVLFCDLRGFSKESEKHANDLLALLERVSRALGVTTQNVLDHGGVVGDFQGDAAMGFWGWPVSAPDLAGRACLAALCIRTVFAGAALRKDHPLAGFQAGVGIATGRAVAGQIGSPDQAKVGVFGPVVNLAARLEGMTKIMRAPILVDETTAAHVRQHFSPATARLRRLAVVKPYGLAKPLTVTELLPPESEYPLLTDEHLAIYQTALDTFIEGDWSEALRQLRRLPADDHSTDFLTKFIFDRDRSPPSNWKGVIPLTTKS
jgi:adenylate cyclase